MVLSHEEKAALPTWPTVIVPYVASTLRGCDGIVVKKLAGLAQSILTDMPGFDEASVDPNGPKPEAPKFLITKVADVGPVEVADTTVAV